MYDRSQEKDLVIEVKEMKTVELEVTDRIGNEWMLVTRELEGFPNEYRVHKNGSIVNTFSEKYNAVRWLGENLIAGM